MATGPAPLPESSPSHTEDDSYDSINQLLKLATKALREFFDSCVSFRPAVLQTKLKGHVTGLYSLGNIRIANHQWDLLFPPDGSDSSSEYYDISLLVLLLKNFGNLGEPPPGFKWDELPALIEISEYHDIARLKWYRNKYAHAAPGSVSEKESSRHFLDLAQAILRIVPESNREQYSVDILTDTRSQKVFKDLKKKVEQGYDGVKKYVGTGTAEVNKNISQVKGQIAAIATGVKKLAEPEDLEVQKDDMSDSLKIEQWKKYYKKSSSNSEKSIFEFDLESIVDQDCEAEQASYESSSNTSITKGMETGTRVKWQKMKQEINTTAEIANLLEPFHNPNKLPILVEAGAGFGKTILLKRILYTWITDQEDMKRFTLVFFIPLRYVRNKKIEDIICTDLKLIKGKYKQLLKKILDRHGDEILFLVDGLNEVKVDPECEILSLLKGKKHHLICSSRPMWDGRLDTSQFLRVKLLGFSDETLSTQFFERYVNVQIPAGECLMRIPLFARTFKYFCDCDRETREHGGDRERENLHGYVEMPNLPNTVTQTFNRYLKEVLTTYGEKSKKIPIQDDPKITFKNSPLELSVPKAIGTKLISIAKLAFKTLHEEKVGFFTHEVKRFGLSQEDIADIGLFTTEGNEELVFFRHRLFQEYFAGLYLTMHEEEISTIFQNETLDQLSTRSHIFQNALLFAAGMSDTISTIQEMVKNQGNTEPSNIINTGDLIDKLRRTLETGKANPLKAKDQLMMAFFLELLLEHTCNRVSRSDVIRIPVNHPLDIALHLSEMPDDALVLEHELPAWTVGHLADVVITCNQNPSVTHRIEMKLKDVSTTLTLKSGPASENCSVTKLTVLKVSNANQSSIDMIQSVEWEGIERIDFENCKVNLPLNFPADRDKFPKLKTVAVYDPNTPLTKKGSKNQEPEIIVQFSAESLKDRKKDCEVCREKYPDSRQFLVTLDELTLQANPGRRLEESISAVCIHCYEEKPLQIDYFLKKNQLNQLNYLHVHEKAHLTEYIGRTHIISSSVKIKMFKKAMKKNLEFLNRALEKRGPSWKATMVFVIPCELQIEGHDGTSRRNITFSYDEMKVICAKRKKEERSEDLEKKQKAAIQNPNSDIYLESIDITDEKKEDNIPYVSMIFKKD